MSRSEQANGFLAGLAARFTVFLVCCVPGLPSSFAQPPALETVAARHQLLADEQRFDGVVEAVFRSTISAQTAGEIVELPFDVNDYVPKDAVVLRFENTRQKAQLDRAIANEAQARARLQEAEARYRRNQRLIKENAVSESEFEKSEADLKSAQAQVELAAADRKEAQEQFDYTVVTAPYAGVLVERFVEIGEQVQVGTKLGTGLSLEKLRVEVQVPARYIQQIRESNQGRVELPGRDGWLQAQDITVFPYADEKSHTFTVRAQLPEGQHGLYPGMLVKVAFTVGEQQYLVVPNRSIVHRSEVTGVYVVDAQGKVAFRQIRKGREVPDDLAVVLAGLEVGEQVALDPIAATIRLKQQNAGHGDE